MQECTNLFRSSIPRHLDHHLPPCWAASLAILTYLVSCRKVPLRPYVDITYAEHKYYVHVTGMSTISDVETNTRYLRYKQCAEE